VQGCLACKTSLAPVLRPWSDSCPRRARWQNFRLTTTKYLHFQMKFTQSVSTYDGCSQPRCAVASSRDNTSVSQSALCRMKCGKWCSMQSCEHKQQFNVLQNCAKTRAFVLHPIIGRSYVSKAEKTDFGSGCINRCLTSLSKTEWMIWFFPNNFTMHFLNHYSSHFCMFHVDDHNALVRMKKN